MSKLSKLDLEKLFGSDAKIILDECYKYLTICLDRKKNKYINYLRYLLAKENNVKFNQYDYIPTLNINYISSSQKEDVIKYLATHPENTTISY